jgi:hypothetical protein
VQCAATTREIGAIIAESQFVPTGGGFIVAHSSLLVPTRLRDLAPAGADLVALAGIDPVVGSISDILSTGTTVSAALTLSVLSVPEKMPSSSLVKVPRVIAMMGLR